jgi:hypothetical protein
MGRARSPSMAFDHICVKRIASIDFDGIFDAIAAFLTLMDNLSCSFR